MKVAIMQPYLLPYIGYFQLIAAVDKFVVYDNIKYTKTGWINRNRMLSNGKAATFTVPLKKASDFLDIRERVLSEGFDRKKLLHRIFETYRRAPFFKDTFRLVEEIVLCPDNNLFNFLYNSLRMVCDNFGIKTEFIISSTVQADHGLKSQDKVIAICKSLMADVYINAIGGQNIYTKSNFSNNGIELFFVQSKCYEYKQFDFNFVPLLSILDVMMFNPTHLIMTAITEGYALI